MNAAPSLIQQIDMLRIEKGFSKEQLAAAAGISRQQYNNILTGRQSTKASTLARLRAALSRLAGRPAQLANPYSRVVLYCYFAVLGMVCDRAGIDVAEVHAQDPQRKATADPAWRRASHLRRQAIYVVNTATGIQQSDIAKALGLTPAAMSLACRAGEDGIDDPDFDRTVAELTRIISGGQFG